MSEDENDYEPIKIKTGKTHKNLGDFDGDWEKYKLYLRQEGRLSEALKWQ